MGIVFLPQTKKYIQYIYIRIVYIIYITCIHLARRLSCVHSLRNIISIAMYISISKTGWENQFAQKLTFVYPSPPKPKIEKKKKLEAQGIFPPSGVTGDTPGDTPKWEMRENPGRLANWWRFSKGRFARCLFSGRIFGCFHSLYRLDVLLVFVNCLFAPLWFI